MPLPPNFYDTAEFKLDIVGGSFVGCCSRIGDDLEVVIIKIDQQG